jgi:hypothetical protein
MLQDTDKNKVPFGNNTINETADETTPLKEFDKIAFRTISTTGVGKRDVLDKMHQMRLNTFEKRINDPMNVKPYLPMLSSDEKELIMEQYFASKKKLSKAIKD